MVKGFIASVVFVCVSMIGVFINKTKRYRLDFYKSYKKYLELSKEGIKNSALTTQEISKKALLICNQDFCQYIEKGILPKYLKEKEKVEIKYFFERFGSKNYETTLSILSDEKIKMEGKLAELEEDLKNKGTLILKLCVLGGIALVILLI